MQPHMLFPFVLLLVSGPLVQALNNGLARTPQMGWNTWNAFACDVSEDLLIGTADKLVELGLRDAGYTYLNLDDCWSAGRDANGTLIADSKKFPNGMKHVADQIHQRRLGFGIYSDAGSLTCARYPGSLGYEEVDAKTWASWGVDYLKYDNCYNEGQSGTPLITFERYKKMAVALNNTGRPILYSMCNWGEDYPWKWAQTVANSWRMSGDIFDTFDRPDPRCPCSGDEGYDCALPGFHCSMMNILNKVTGYVDKGIPGAWNDLDMLEVGNGGMTDSEYKIHFTMWAAVKSPLIMGNDLREMKAADLSILLNPAILALSQDALGSSASRRWRYMVSDTDTYGQGEVQMWSGQLAGGDWVVLLVNAGTQERSMNATLADIFVDEGGAHSEHVTLSWDVYDLWSNRMSESVAQGIIDSNSTASIEGKEELGYWNNTAMSYADGIAKGDPRLMGQLVGSVQPMGVLTAQVGGHDIAAYRIRNTTGTFNPARLARKGRLGIVDY